MMEPTVLFNENMQLVPFIFSKRFCAYENHKEDLLQEGYLALWKACMGFDDSRGVEFSTYACAAITNQMCLYVQRVIRKHQSVISLNTVIFDDGEGSELQLEEAIADNSCTKSYAIIIHDCLAKVKHKDKKIILKFLDGFTQDEVAEQCSVSQPTVCRCLKRFKNILMEEIE